MNPVVLGRLIVFVLTTLLAVVPGGYAQSNECPTPINGALRGESGNIQDHTFHSLAIDPTDPNIVYVGTETSGMFKTIDGGNSWTRLRTGLKCTSNKTGYSQVFDVIPDPVNPQVLYAATVNGPGPGDDPSFPSASGGVYKSTDGGESWVQKIQGLDNTYASWVLIDSTSPNRIYTGIGGLRSSFSGSTNQFYEGGIYSSDDGGDTWSPLPLPDGVGTNVFINMALRGTQQRTLYASAQVHGTDAPTAYGLIRSRDGGQTWTIVNPPGQTISGFDVFQQDPDIIYGHDLSPSRRAHKSTDGGDTWTMLNGGFFGVIRIHPTDSNTLYYTGRTSIMKSINGFASSQMVYDDASLSGVEQMTDIEISLSNPNVVWAAAKGYYFYRSTDAGNSFTRITAVRELIYGNPLRQAVPAVESDATQLTGLALVNTGSDVLQTSITAYDDSGLRPSESEPVLLSAAPGEQVSRLTSELFPARSGRNWIEMVADRGGLVGFFLGFDTGLNTMDGGNLSNRPVPELIFPEVGEAEILLINSGGLEADVVARLITNDGTETALETRLIPPKGRFAARVSDLFPGAPGAAGYVRITSSRGLASLEQFGVPGVFLNALKGLEADESSRQLFSPQYVHGGGLDERFNSGESGGRCRDGPGDLVRRLGNRSRSACHCLACWPRSSRALRTGGFWGDGRNVDRRGILAYQQRYARHRRGDVRRLGPKPIRDDVAPGRACAARKRLRARGSGRYLLHWSGGHQSRQPARRGGRVCV